MIKIRKLDEEKTNKQLVIDHPEKRLRSDDTKDKLKKEKSTKNQPS
jgi:hypothetical protein